MNLEVLGHIINNDVERIEELAEEGGYDAVASVGIAKMVLAKGGDVVTLSDRQTFLFKQCVLPLIENVPCEGVIGYVEDGGDTCLSGGVIDDESLMGAYLEDDFKCQHCRYEAERMAED